MIRNFTSIGWIINKSTPITNPCGLFFILPFAFVSLTATSVHEPGDAPQSMTVWPGLRIFVRSLISISLNALRHLKIIQTEISSLLIWVTK